MHFLKSKYKSEIKINVGFEIDYLPGFEDWTIDLLNEYGKQIDDSILSLHFQKVLTDFDRLIIVQTIFMLALSTFMEVFKKPKKIIFPFIYK